MVNLYSLYVQDDAAIKEVHDSVVAAREENKRQFGKRCGAANIPDALELATESREALARVLRLDMTLKKL